MLPIPKRGFGLFLARVLLTVPVLFAAWERVLDWDATSDTIAGKELPKSDLLLAGAMIVIVAGCASVIAGFKTRVGTLLLLVLVAVVTLVFQDFWSLVPGHEYELRQVTFFKNLGLIGGLYLLFVLGPGTVSVDEIREQRKRA